MTPARRTYLKAWRAKNREKVRLYKKLSRQRNVGHYRDKDKEYYRNRKGLKVCLQEVEEQFDLEAVALPPKYDLRSKFCECMPDENRLIGPKDQHIHCGKQAVAYRIPRCMTNAETHRQLVCADHKVQFGDDYKYEPLHAAMDSTPSA